MLVHKNVLISNEVISEEFACNISACKGACCVEGDYGAPVTEEEELQLINEMENIRPYLDDEAKEIIRNKGITELDYEDEKVTQCKSNGECIFTSKDENGNYICNIEKAFKEGKSKVNKPISCSLYPIRISQIADMEALNYDRWHICSPACELGKQRSIPVYAFVKDALISKYGSDWYNELEAIIDNLPKEFKL